LPHLHGELPDKAAAAGAMVYVVVEELIPQTVRSGTTDVATLGLRRRFTVMMSLDNALGRGQDTC
jgi:ZIP family zinc transporter